MAREKWRHSVNFRYTQKVWPPGRGRLQGRRWDSLGLKEEWT